MFGLLKKAYPYYGKIYGILGGCILLGLFQNVLALVEPQIIALMVDRAITPALGYQGENDSSIFLFLIEGIPSSDVWKIMWILTGTFLFFLLLYFITFYTRWNLAHYFSIKQDNKLRTDVIKKIHSFGTRIFGFYNPGELVTIANSDTGKMRDAHIAVIPFMIDSIFAIVAGAVFLSRISLVLMMVPLVTLVLYILNTRKFLNQMGGLYGNLWTRKTALTAEIQESIYGIRTIKAYAAEKLRFLRFMEKNRDVRDCAVELGHTRYRFMLLLNGGNLIVTLLCMTVSISLALRMKMTSGEYMAFISYMLIIVGSFVDLVFHMANLQECGVSADRLFVFLQKEDVVRNKYGNKSISKRPDISVEHLTVVDEGKILLDHIDLEIPFGKKIGIMGKTGSGKSVFFKALQALVEAEEGCIRFDGAVSTEYSMQEILSVYGYAMQDVYLFSNTIEGNIAYANPLVSFDKILFCAELAKVDEFAAAMPDGYQSVIGEKGFGLSGGQKQRIAIARALLKDAPVLLMDDCTSALDLETEREIVMNLNEYAGNKTLLMATHRASAIRDFDEIIYFEDGKIAERGTFEELMAMQGRYAAVYHQQGGRHAE